MAQLRRDFEQFEQANLAVLVIGPEGEEAFARYWQEHDLPFIGLPDPKHTVLKQFGQEIKLTKWGRMPAQLIVDRGGIIRFVHYGHSMSDIPENAEILKLTASLQGKRPKSAP